MKIIISPAKTLKPQHEDLLQNKELLYPAQHKNLLNHLCSLTKEELQQSMRIKGSLLDTTYNNIQKHDTLSSFQAFPSYDGLVYKNLDKSLYKAKEYGYIEEHLRILDAFYGALEPGTLIKPYRLDFTMKIGLNLYDVWKLDNLFQDEVIINLASDEFAKMLHSNKMITIKFLQNKHNILINQATYTKMARGQLLHFMIINQVKDIEAIKAFDGDGYHYHSRLSNDTTIVFTR